MERKHCLPNMIFSLLYIIFCSTYSYMNEKIISTLHREIALCLFEMFFFLLKSISSSLTEKHLLMICSFLFVWKVVYVNFSIIPMNWSWWECVIQSNVSIQIQANKQSCVFTSDFFCFQGLRNLLTEAKRSGKRACDNKKLETTIPMIYLRLVTFRYFIFLIR